MGFLLKESCFFTDSCENTLDREGVYCEQWQKGGLCHVHKKEMTRFCRKSCGYCQIWYAEWLDIGKDFLFTWNKYSSFKSQRSFQFTLNIFSSFWLHFIQFILFQFKQNMEQKINKNIRKIKPKKSTRTWWKNHFEKIPKNLNKYTISSIFQ